MATRLRATCIHEAAHVVAAVRLRIKVANVSVIPDSDSYGRVTRVSRARIPWPSEENDYEESLSQAASRIIHRELIYALVGGVAETFFKVTNSRHIPDWKSVNELHHRLEVAGLDAQSHLDQAYAEALELVKTNKKAIRAIALTLSRVRTIGRNTLHRIIREADNGK